MKNKKNEGDDGADDNDDDADDDGAKEKGVVQSSVSFSLEKETEEP